MTRRRLIRLLLCCGLLCAALAALAPHLPGQGLAALACHPAPILLCRILHAAGVIGGMP